MNKSNEFRLPIFFATVYFFSINGLGALPNLSINFLLKEKMHLSPAQAAYFQAITLLSWVVKPLWGFISDTCPLFGYRRKSYLILMTLLGGISWFVLGMSPSYSVIGLLVCVTLVSTAYAFQDVVTDGLMVEVGQPLGKTGHYQSIQWGAVYLAMMVTALGGGYLSDLTRSGQLKHQTLFLICALFPLATFAAISWGVNEPRQVLVEDAKRHFKNVLTHKPMWLLSLFLFLWTFSPSFGAPFFYYSVDKLKFSGQFIGLTQFVASLSALLTSIFLGKWIDRIPMRRALVATLFVGIVTIIFHLIYFVPQFIQHVDLMKNVTLITRIPLAIIDTVIFLMLANLAAKSAPQDAGGAVFAIFMSFYNLGQVGSGILGGILLPFLGLPKLMVVSAFFSLLALLVLPYLSIEEDLTSVERFVKKILEKRMKQ